MSVELTVQNSYPCPKCSVAKPKDEFEWCAACRATNPAPPDKPCPHCDWICSGYLRRCDSCHKKLRPPGRTRDMTATQDGGRKGAQLFEDNAPAPEFQPNPLIQGMLAYLPDGGSWDLLERHEWLSLMASNLALVYGEHAEQFTIEVRLVPKRKSASWLSKALRTLGLGE